MGIANTFAKTCAYAYYSVYSKTLTFTYGVINPSEGHLEIDDYDNQTYPMWYRQGTYLAVERVVFDPKFAQARPKSTAYWFYGMEKLTSIEGWEYLNTTEVTSMSSMFCGCSILTSVDLSHFNTSNVVTMNGMFSDCKKLTSLDLSNFDTRKVTNMRMMFEDCNALTSLDLSNFNTLKVTDMGGMFLNCNHLISIDLSGFSTSQVTDMGSLFENCKNLTSVNLSSFNTSNVTDMDHMFTYCEKLSSLDLSNFNTSKATTMAGMFSNCKNLLSLDLFVFNTSNVTNMDDMFYACSNLKTIFAGSGWSTTSVYYSRSMFKNCNSLVGGAGTTYNANHIDASYAHIDGGPSNPGYFTEKQLEYYDLWIKGGQVSNVNCNNISNAFDVSGTVTYNPSSKTLTLENASLHCGTSLNGACIRSGIDGLNIRLKGTNVIVILPSGTNLSGMVLANTTISGDTLGIQSRRSGIIIQGGKTVTINNVSLLKATGSTYGIYSSTPANTHLAVKGGRTKVDASGSSGAISGMNYLDLSDGLKIMKPAGGYFSNAVLYDANGNVATQAIISGNLRGDVNGDGKVNVSDVTTLVNMILGVIPKDETRADINGDGKINVSDVTALVNIILGIQ